MDLFHDVTYPVTSLCQRLREKSKECGKIEVAMEIAKLSYYPDVTETLTKRHSALIGEINQLHDQLLELVYKLVTKE